MPNREEKTLARLVADLQELDRLRSELELTQYQASDPDHAEKFALLDEVAKILQPLVEPLTDLASRQSMLATLARLDDAPSFERAAFHGDWPIVLMAHINGGNRFNALVYILDGGYALARHNRLDNGEDGLELVFHLSDETASCFYCRCLESDSNELRLTLTELQAIQTSLPIGLVALQQRIEQEKATIREQMEQLVRSLGQTGV